MTRAAFLGAAQHLTISTGLHLLSGAALVSERPVSSEKVRKQKGGTSSEAHAPERALESRIRKVSWLRLPSDVDTGP